MAWAATGIRMTPAELLAAVIADIPDGYEVTTRSQDWGSWLVAERNTDERATWLRRGRWLAIGEPSASPWANPYEPAPLSAVIDRAERFGGGAATLFSGPLTLIDLLTGTWHCALNGLLAEGPHLGDLRVSTLSARRRNPAAAADPIADPVPGFSYARLVAEVDSHLPALEQRIGLGDPTAPGHTDLGGRDWALDIYPWGPHALISRPANLARVLADPALLDEARHRVVPELAWRAERCGKTLVASYLERVVLDQIGFGDVRAAS